MAYVTEIHCKECGETKREVTRYDNTCQSCRTTIKERARRMYLAALNGLTVEERMEKIEAQLYDLDAESRLRIIEASTRRYA